MSRLSLLSIRVSPMHPDLSEMYDKLGIDHVAVGSERKAIKALKSFSPDLVVADFLYGYGNNYAGINVCNLDVFLYSLQKEAPDSKLIVFAEKNELEYIDKLKALFDVDEVYSYPLDLETYGRGLTTICS